MPDLPIKKPILRAIRIGLRQLAHQILRPVVWLLSTAAEYIGLV